MKNIIFEHNPWWKDKEDYHLTKWRAMKIKWSPSWKKDISLKPFSLNFVIGPRQVGKTTGLKILINDLSKRVEAERIFYFNCDFTPDVYSLRKVVDGYLEFKKSWGHSSSFIFLDEITAVKGWWRVVKGYIDLGAFRDDVLTVTGSSSLRLMGDVELFPGRRGAGKEITAHPLSFREFLGVHGSDVKTTGDLRKDMRRVAVHGEEISRAFQAYLEKGGFPLPINEDPAAGADFIKALEGEILRLERSVSLAREIFSSVFKKAPSPLAYTTIAKDTSGYSYKTVAEYLELFKNLLVLGIANHREREKILHRKEKKIFFTDPFVARTLSGWSGQEFLESAFYEWVVQSHLLRRFGEIFYYRNSYEIDCIAGDLNIEVKTGKPHRKYPKNVEVLGEDLPLFLAVL
jgi:predicted AAA+ superfamily ATPase